MAKNLKLNIKNTQIAKALNLGSVKEKLAQKKASAEDKEKKPDDAAAKKQDRPTSKDKKTLLEEVQHDVISTEEAPRMKARSKSVFAHQEEMAALESKELIEEAGEEILEVKNEPDLLDTEEAVESPQESIFEEAVIEAPAEELHEEEVPIQVAEIQEIVPEKPEIKVEEPVQPPAEAAPLPKAAKPVKLGPTGRHIKDLLAPKYPKKPEVKEPEKAPIVRAKEELADKERDKSKVKPKVQEPATDNSQSLKEVSKKKSSKGAKFKEFRDLKPARRETDSDRLVLRDGDEFQRWRKKRHGKHGRELVEETTIRPTSLKIRIPIVIKDLASEMKLKASQLVEKLFLQGAIYTLNDILDDETTIQLLGHEFGCEIAIDTSEEKRIQITDQSIKEEIGNIKPELLITRAPVVAFMGHVDHGKTSLIDAIRASNRVAGEAGAITQHIGAFRCNTPVGPLTILDTPGHAAFSAMRARGADVTDIVVLVIAGDEGSMPQTQEAIQHAKAAGVTIVVAINKCDKPTFDVEKVYRQLADQDLLPEAWGGQTITINCSAKTGEGVKALVEMLALQAEVLELKSDPTCRARGRVIESEMHKGLGAKATLLIQNGTLRHGDALVFDEYWGYVKTMHDENGKTLKEAPPSTPVEITGLSGLPTAGQEFIVVSNEKEARDIAERRAQKIQNAIVHRRPITIESLLSESTESPKKVLNIILRADVQGSLEALKTALLNIETEKVHLNIIFTAVGEISESDVQLAAASKAVIIGFHTKIESHAESLIKQYNVQVRLHDVIYHAIDSAKELMTGKLDKLSKEVIKGKADVLATFKSSQHGIIAGCQVTEGSIVRNNHVRIIRDGKEIWKGSISSLKRHKDDVKEVKSGFECGILVSSNDIREGDKIEAFEIVYFEQEL